MPSPRYDLHVHSRAARGALAPRELVALAVERGLAGIAITDINAVDGLDEAQMIAPALGIRIVPGVHITCIVSAGTPIGILGYFITSDHAELNAMLIQASAADGDVQVSDVVRVIHASGGVAVLAHPGRMPGGINRDAILRAVEAGIDGIEVDHPDHTDEDMQLCAEIARTYGLVQTAGSDDQGGDGSRLGCRTVSSATLSELEQRSMQYRDHA